MKRCRRCEETKPLAEFHQCAATKDGYKAQCKPCRNRVILAARRKKREEGPPPPIDPMEWIRELAQIKQQQPHSFF